MIYETETRTASTRAWSRSPTATRKLELNEGAPSTPSTGRAAT